MVSVLGTNVDVEETQAMEEGRSVLASFITQLMAIVHRILSEMLAFSRRFIQYASENPLALVLLASNVMIWIS
jgi:hypothetical protein